MSYAVHITVTMDDGAVLFDRILDNHDDLDEALDHAEDVCTSEYDRTGIEPMPFDTVTPEEAIASALDPQ